MTTLNGFVLLGLLLVASEVQSHAKIADLPLNSSQLRDASFLKDLVHDGEGSNRVESLDRSKLNGRRSRQQEITSADNDQSNSKNRGQHLDQKGETAEPVNFWEWNNRPSAGALKNVADHDSHIGDGVASIPQPVR